NSANVIAWDPGTNTWLPLPDLVQPRDFLGGATVGGAFYTVGGGQGGWTSGTTDVQRYLPPCTSPTPVPPSPTPCGPNAWSLVAPYPTPISENAVDAVALRSGHEHLQHQPGVLHHPDLRAGRRLPQQRPDLPHRRQRHRQRLPCRGLYYRLQLLEHGGQLSHRQPRPDGGRAGQLCL